MSMSKLKKKAIATIAGLMVVSSSTSVFAGTTYYDFGGIVPKENGSKFTKSQTKVTAGAAGEIRNYYTGADCNTDVRMVDSDGNVGRWARNLNKASSYYAMDGDVEHKKGDKIHLEFSSDKSTSVDYDISGQWRSN